MGKKYNYTIEELKKVVSESKSFANVFRLLNIRSYGGNYKTIKNLIKEHEINVSHFNGQLWYSDTKFYPDKKKKDIKDIMVENSTFNSNSLKKRLFSEGLKEKICECCKNTHWLDEPIKLELHHKNGDNTDNRFENLEILCPNCHSYTDNYRGKNLNKSKKNKLKKEIYLLNKDNLPKAIKEKPIKPKKEKPLKEPKYCLHCGKETEGSNKYCDTICYRESNSKNRPTVFELIEVMKTYKNNYSAVGRHYNVSDNAIRKWIKIYKIEEQFYKQT